MASKWQKCDVTTLWFLPNANHYIVDNHLVWSHIQNSEIKKSRKNTSQLELGTRKNAIFTKMKKLEKSRSVWKCRRVWLFTFLKNAKSLICWERFQCTIDTARFCDLLALDLREIGKILNVFTWKRHRLSLVDREGKGRHSILAKKNVSDVTHHCALQLQSSNFFLLLFWWRRNYFPH